MGGMILKSGAAYEVAGGKTLVAGTAYHIAGGKTLAGGTAYDILFQRTGTLVNLIEDGNFANNTWWSKSGCTFNTYKSNTAYTRASSDAATDPQLYRDGIAGVSGHVYYLRGELGYRWTGSGTPPEPGGVALRAGDGSVALSCHGYPLTDAWAPVSVHGAVAGDTVSPRLLLPTRGGANHYGYSSLTVQWRNVVLVDLTAAFGPGGEPGQAACDSLIPYFQGEYELTV